MTLLDYIIKKPKNEEANNKKFKFPFIACEVLNCNSENILRQFFLNHKKKKLIDEKYNKLIEARITNNSKQSLNEIEEESKKKEVDDYLESLNVQDDEKFIEVREDAIIDITDEKLIDSKLEVNEESHEEKEKEKDKLEEAKEDKKPLPKSVSQISSLSFKIEEKDLNKFELLEYFFSFISEKLNDSKENTEVNDVLSGYFHRFFLTLYNRSPLQIFKYISETSPEILNNLLKNSHIYSISEIILLIIDNSCFFDDDLEYEGLMNKFIIKIFEFLNGLSDEELLERKELYKLINEKLNIKLVDYLFKNMNITQKIIRNSFLGIDLSKINSKINLINNSEKIDKADYLKYKEIRLTSIEILIKLLNEIEQRNIVSSISFLEPEKIFCPISMKNMMKILMYGYGKFKQFSWFYNDDVDAKQADKSEETEDELKEREYNINEFFKVYEKEEVLKFFYSITEVLISKNKMLEKISDNKTEFNEILASYDLLNQFKNINGEDIMLNTKFLNTLIKLFPIFTFLFHLDTEKMKDNKDGENYEFISEYDSTLNNTKNKVLGEEKIQILRFIEKLLHILDNKNCFITRISDNLKSIITLIFVSSIF